MIDLTQLAVSLQNIDYPAYRNMSAANELLGQTYDAAMSSAAEYITSYTAVQTFDNAGNETTSDERKRNALGTVFRSLKTIADRYGTIVDTAKSQYFSMSTTPGLRFADVSNYNSCCIQFQQGLLNLIPNRSYINAVCGYSRVSSGFEHFMFNARSIINSSAALDGSGWAMGTRFPVFHINQSTGIINRVDNDIIIIIERVGDIATTSGVVRMRVVISRSSSGAMAWTSPDLTGIYTNVLDNLNYCLTRLVQEYNRSYDSFMAFAPGTIGGFWEPLSNVTITDRGDIGVISIVDPIRTWESMICITQMLQPEDTDMFKDVQAREDMIRSYMLWARGQ